MKYLDSVKLFGEGGTKKGRTFVIINLNNNNGGLPYGYNITIQSLC